MTKKRIFSNIISTPQIFVIHINKFSKLFYYGVKIKSNKFVFFHNPSLLYKLDFPDLVIF